MPKRCFLFSLLAVVVLSAHAFAQTAGAGDGPRELALGREAYARRDFQGAAAHLSRAVEGLGRDQQALSDAYLRLGIVYLVGLASPAQALPAFLSSAELSPDPATALLWAAAAAEKLGQKEVADRLKARALSPPAAPVETRVETRAETRVETRTAAPAPLPAEPPKPAATPPAQPAPRQEPPAGRPAAPVASAPEETPEPAAGEAQPAAKPDAFQYFFGKGRKKPEKGGEAGKPAESTPPPPAG